MRHLAFVILIGIAMSAQGQSDTYREIPDYPAEYTPATVVARMIDGLGYRYYWATEGLTEIDLAYRADETARTSHETLEHIHQLSLLILNGVKNKPNLDRPKGLTFIEMQNSTLANLHEISTLLKDDSTMDLAERNIIFQRGDKTSEFPFWHQLNGPIADALWHVGQIVANRRASGNPIDSRVNVFSGKMRG